MIIEYISGIATTVVAAIVGIAVWYFKRSADKTDSNIEKLDAKIEKHNTELQEYRLYSEQKFASKDELIRAISSIDRKLDKMSDQMYDIIAKIERKG